MKKSKTEQKCIKIIEQLKQNNQTISFAESCTGGRIAAAFTAISGASGVFDGSVVSYANEIKSKWLGVKEQTLIKHGAVSQECVEEMLEGILKMASSDYAIAVSGIAGPTGGTAEKPVGTVYIGIASKNEKKVTKYHFTGSRVDIQEQSTLTAIDFLQNFL